MNWDSMVSLSSYLLSMNLAGASLCRCGQANSCDLLLNPFHSSNCRLNSRERTFKHTAVCLLLSKVPRRASPTSRVTLEPRDASAAHHPDIAVEDNAILYHVDVSIVEPTSEHAMSANIAAAMNKGAAAASKETAKIATYSGTDWANVIPFVLSLNSDWTSRNHTFHRRSSRCTLMHLCLLYCICIPQNCLGKCYNLYQLAG